MQYRYAHGRLRFPDADNLVSGAHEHHRSVLLEGMTWPAPVILPLRKRCPLCVAVRRGSELVLTGCLCCLAFGLAAAADEPPQSFAAYLKAELAPEPSWPTADAIWGQTERDRV